MCAKNLLLYLKPICLYFLFNKLKNGCQEGGNLLKVLEINLSSQLLTILCALDINSGLQRPLWAFWLNQSERASWITWRSSSTTGRMATRKHAESSGRAHAGDRGGSDLRTAGGHTGSLVSVSLNFQSATIIVPWKSPLCEGVVSDDHNNGDQQLSSWRCLWVKHLTLLTKAGNKPFKFNRISRQLDSWQMFEKLNNWLQSNETARAPQSN